MGSWGLGEYLEAKQVYIDLDEQPVDWHRVQRRWMRSDPLVHPEVTRNASRSVALRKTVLSSRGFFGPLIRAWDYDSDGHGVAQAPCQHELQTSQRHMRAAIPPQGGHLKKARGKTRTNRIETARRAGPTRPLHPSAKPRRGNRDERGGSRALSEPSPNRPYYATSLGAAYLGDARHLLKGVATETVDLIMTSPPFALKRKKEYGNVDDHAYLEWFRQFVPEFIRVLKPTGSLVIDIGGTWVKGQPTRSLYHFELLLMLCKEFGLHLAQEFYWLNPARLPSPAEWVTVRRLRVKDAVDPVWWLCKTPHPIADNRRVLVEYSPAMKALLKNGYRAKLRPSGHDISTNFSRDNKGAIPPNLLEIANTESNSRYLSQCRAAGLRPHPARYPRALPEFFIKFLTDSVDALVLDPFAGSNVTGEAAESLGRHWMAFEMEEEYLQSSRFRFTEDGHTWDRPARARRVARGRSERKSSADPTSRQLPLIRD